MRADLALIGFILTLAGGITLLVLRRRRGGVPLLLGGIVLLLAAACEHAQRQEHCENKCKSSFHLRSFLLW